MPVPLPRHAHRDGAAPRIPRHEKYYTWDVGRVNRACCWQGSVVPYVYTDSPEWAKVAELEGIHVVHEYGPHNAMPTPRHASPSTH